MIPMQDHKTQQFARFFLKDLKSEKSKYNEDKPIFEDLKYSSSN